MYLVPTPGMLIMMRPSMLVSTPAVASDGTWKIGTPPLGDTAIVPPVKSAGAFDSVPPPPIDGGSTRRLAAVETLAAELIANAWMVTPLNPVAVVIAVPPLTVAAGARMMESATADA